MTDSARLRGQLEIAAKFIHQDPGDEGFMGRLAAALGDADPDVAAYVIDKALAAREWAGRAVFVLGEEAGYCKVGSASTGATYMSTAAKTIKPDAPNDLSVGVVLGDANGPIEGMAVQATFQPGRNVEVGITDKLGYVTMTAIGATVEISYGVPANPLP